MVELLLCIVKFSPPFTDLLNRLFFCCERPSFCVLLRVILLSAPDSHFISSIRSKSRKPYSADMEKGSEPVGRAGDKPVRLLFSEVVIAELAVAMDATSLITTVTQLMGPITDLYQQQSKGHATLKPPTVVVRQYEEAVYAFRDQPLPGAVKGVRQLLVESVEAFEAGRVLDAGRHVMLALEQFEAAGKESAVSITPDQAGALGQFRSRLFKLVVPAPELKQKRADL